MTKETTQKGASGNDTGHASKRPAFQPAGEYARQGVDNQDDSGEDGDGKPKSFRDAVMEEIESRIDEERMKAIGLEMEEFNSSIEEQQEPPAEPIEEGTDEEEEAEPVQDEPEGHADQEEEVDPLADFIVMDEENDTPMFVLKVDGKETYIPVEKARQQLQKHEAAEVRLQNAANFARQLEAREAQILAAEQALQAKQETASQASPPSVPPVPDVSDQDLRKEAQQFVASMFSGTDEDAVEQLAHLLGRMRAVAPPGQQIDPEALAKQAAQAAREQLRKDEVDKDVKTGFAKFEKDYPDIISDPELFRHADSMTDAIEAEWKAEGRSYMPSEVMSEAGKRTRSWVEKLSGKTPDTQGSQTRTKDRQVRKRKLRPMPKAGSKKQALREPVEQEQTPHDYVAELKKARGQA